MNNEPILPPEYTIAEGPEGLKKVLEDFLKSAQEDVAFANEAHYILYQLGNQKSLIRADFSKKPFQFWYYDLLGRPATKAVKETIVEFLWEKCGEKERYFADSEEKVNE